LLGLFTVLPKFWISPGGPIYWDETAQFALLQNTIWEGRLFLFTPLLPIGTFYPGLQGAAATIHWLTGLSPWDSALTLIAVVHCLVPVRSASPAGSPSVGGGGRRSLRRQSKFRLL
jgi:hypothetical protein